MIRYVSSASISIAQRLLACAAMLLLPACQSASAMESDAVTLPLEQNEQNLINTQSQHGDHGGGHGGHDDDDDEDQCLVPGPFEPFFAGEEAYFFKSIRSTVAPYLDPSACDDAAFVPNIIAGARMTSVKYRESDAAVGDPEQEEVGLGTLCFKLQDPTFSAFGTPLLAHGKLTVNGISITIDGQCTITNQNTPAPGVHLMTCALPVTQAPPGYSGGLLTTNSVLNVAGVPGISTGSLLALHLYTN